MVTFLITSLVILAFLAVAAYFWQKPALSTKTESLIAPPGRGLFINGTPEGVALAAAKAESEAIANAERRRTELLDRARGGEKSTLQEAQTTSDDLLYDEVLNSLVAAADSGPALLSLVSYITRHELRVNRKLAETFIDSCKSVLDRNATAKMLHLAALSNDATVYQTAVETALESWRSGQLSSVSPLELRAILEGEFWILSSATRSSGAGFHLKRTLTAARRELEAAHND
ncbi:MAG: hypothetical protein ND866_28905 [Pyrinomonadaceae bacterium]|nr:hypothetical protein [Pyrinomonadaceae bacterium]